MIDPIPFLSPRLDGKRFEKHTIPLEILKDLAVLEEMVIEVAKWRFLQENSQRTRSPRGFADGISLDLTDVGDGSAIPKIAILAATVGMLPHNNLVYFEQARESIIAAVDAAEHGEPITAHLPESLLGYFDRIGRSLRDGEAIEFAPTNTARPARLNKATRRKLLLASPKVQELTDDVILRGSIPGIQLERKTFDMHVLNGSTVSGNIPDLHSKIVLEAVNGFDDGVRVLLKGVGRFNRSDRLQAIDSVEHISILDPNDVPARLDDLRGLKDGWLDGKGLAPSAVGLDWFTKSFEANYPEELPLPYVYPTAEGGIQAEWTLGEHDLSLEVDFSNHHGEWHILNLKTGEDSIRDLNLDHADDWKWLVQQISQLVGGQS